MPTPIPQPLITPDGTYTWTLDVDGNLLQHFTPNQTMQTLEPKTLAELNKNISDIDSETDRHTQDVINAQSLTSNSANILAEIASRKAFAQAELNAYNLLHT